MELLFISTAFFTAFAWAITQVMDKEVIDNHLSSAATVTFFTAVVSFLLGFVGVPLGKVGVPAMNSMFLLFLVGIAYTSATFLYMRALNFEDVGVVAVLQKIGSVFTVLLAVMVLGERFTVVQFGGMALVLSGVWLASVEFSIRDLSVDFGKAFLYMVGSTFLFSLGWIGTKYVLAATNYWSAYFWSRTGGLIPLLLIFVIAEYREKVLKVFRQRKKYNLWLILLSEVINSLGILMYTLTYSLGPAAIAATLSSVTPLIVPPLTYTIHRLGIGNLDEDYSRRSVIKKILAAALTIAGIYLL